MRNYHKQKSLILLIAGISIIVFGQLIEHYVGLPDFANGSFIGIGIGVILAALGSRKPKTA